MTGMKRVVTPGRLFLFAITLALAIAAFGIASAADVGGVLGYWRFEEGSGTNAADASGHDIDGTLTSTVAWSSDVPPSPSGNSFSLEFNGSSSYVDTGTEVIPPNSSFSVGAWVKRENTKTAMFLGQGGPQVKNSLLHVGFIDSNFGTLFACNWWLNDMFTSTTEVADTGIWHHWTCTYDLDSKTRRAYVDGNLIGTQTGVEPFDGQGGPFVIGGNPNQGNVHNIIDGNIDEVCVVNRALLATEVNDLKDNGCSQADTGPQVVDIDIKPNGDPSSFGCKSKGNIPVAVLGSATFDISEIDADTVRFGKYGTETGEAHQKWGVAKRHVEDFNDDGFDDMIFHFDFQSTGFSCADIPNGGKSADLVGKFTGALTDETLFNGEGDLRLVAKSRNDGS